MAYTVQPTESLIKFVRGTKSQFEQITKQNDTLYFVYDTINSTKGELWLGNKQIGDGGVENLASLITSEVSDGDLLIYDAVSEDWITVSVDDAIRTMSGATATSNGQSGLVPTPQAGDQNKFLKGDGTWATVESGSIAVDEKSIIEEDGELSLKGFATAPAGSIPQKNSSGELSWTTPSITSGMTYKKVDNLSEIIDSNTIYLVPNNASELNNSFDEYMLIDGEKEIIGVAGDINLENYVTIDSLTSTLSQYVTSDGLTDYITTDILTSTVGNLTQLIRKTGQEDSTIVDEINYINERLAWGEIIEE